MNWRRAPHRPAARFAWWSGMALLGVGGAAGIAFVLI